MSDCQHGRPAFLHPIPAGWLAASPALGGPSYGELSAPDEIAAVLAHRPDSVVALDFPQYTPEARRAGLSFTDSLPAAARHLQSMKDRGLYTPVTGALFGYEMREADGHAVRALIGLVSTSEFASEPGDPGRISRNEDVFADRVADQRQHIEALGHLLSPILLLPGQQQSRYDELLAAIFATLPPEPLVTDTDERGIRHSVWRADGAAGQIGRVLDDNVFLVADGNHRSLAAQLSGSPWCLAVLASATDLRIEPHNRLLRVPGLASRDVPRLLAGAGVDLVRTGAPGNRAAGPAGPGDDGSYLYLGDGEWYRLGLPAAGAGSDIAAALPHSAVERHVLGAGLGLDPAAPEVCYVGGRDQASYLTGEVDERRATAAVLLRAVTIEEFTAINAARQRMPRKSTWFMPKARAGLVIARAGRPA
jgi:uncharacterized protein (DUF1015 family)